jgi:hypothetical protein
MDIEKLIEELKREAAVKAEPYDSGGTLEWEAIDALLTTMQAREATLIDLLREAGELIQPFNRAEDLSERIDEALGTSGLVP